MHHRTKHIKLDHFYILKKHQNGSVEIGYISFQAQQANIFMKSLKEPTFIQDRKAAGLKKIPTEI